MQVKELSSELYSALKGGHIENRTFSIRYLNILKSEIRYQLAAGLLSEEVYKEHKLDFPDNTGELLPGAKSIIITATPQPQLRVTFKLSSGERHFVVPPTYENQTDQTVERIIRDVISPYGYSLSPIAIPLKLAAVHSGLATYGKNNTAYVNGMGSFHRLKAFLSDFPTEDTGWYNLKMLDKCNNCVACIKKCPTSAILRDGFVLKQERCLTFHNERVCEFPDWIKSTWHNCLIGCMYCQTICPANRDFRSWIEDSVVFSESETEYFLNGDSEHISSLLIQKLAKIGLADDFKQLQRNLKVLITEQRAL